MELDAARQGRRKSREEGRNKFALSTARWRDVLRRSGMGSWKGEGTE